MDHTRVSSKTLRLRSGELLSWMLIEDVLTDGTVTWSQITDGPLDGESITKGRIEQLLAEGQPVPPRGVKLCSEKLRAG